MHLQHLVLDFDCTLSVYHVFKSQRESKGNDARRSCVQSLKRTDMSTWDSASQRFASLLCNHNKILGMTRTHGQWADSQQTAALHQCPDLVTHMFGGKKRIQQLRAFLQELRDNRIIVHISTHGYVHEVHDLLETVGLRPLFAYIHGLDDTYERFVVTPEEPKYGIDPNLLYDSGFFPPVPVSD
jgi:hypothetical protein